MVQRHREHRTTPARREPTAISAGFSPFHVAAMDYLNAGYLPIPLPMGQKSPPPDGTPNALDVTEKQVKEWLDDPRPRNIGCIVPDGIVVADVDGPIAKENLRELEYQLEDLPGTWMTFRGNPDRYHAWYSVKPGMKWPGKLADGVDVIYRHYRYMVLPPSIHPDGGQYRWVSPNGLSEYQTYLPGPDEFYDMPQSWQERFGDTGGYVSRARAEVDSRLWLREHGAGKACPEMKRLVARHKKLLRQGANSGGMHDAMINTVWAMLAEIAHGHKGGERALRQIRNEFYALAAETGRRDAKSAEAEWIRACVGGIEQTAVEAVRLDDPCIVEEAERGKDPERFFDPKLGLRAKSLRREVENGGKLAVGVGGVIYRHANGVWRPDGLSEITRRVDRLMGERYRPTQAANVISVVQSREPTITDEAQDTRYLNLPNGLLNWQEGILYPHNPNVISTIRIPVKWNPDAECPEINKWLNQVFPSDAVELAMEILGYMLYNGNPLNKAILLHGTGRNGKGTFLRLARMLVGGNNVSAITPQALDSSNFSAAELYGKLANLVGDVDPRIFKSTERFKQLTGDDYMDAQRKFGQPFQFRCAALMVAAFNSLPRTADTTEGFFSRWIVIPFTGYYPAGKADTGLIHRMTTPSELEGLLRGAVHGLQRVMDRGYFKTPRSVELATAKFRMEADPIRAFVAQCMRGAPSEKDFVSRTEIYMRYTTWAALNGFQAMSNSRFYESMNSVIAELIRTPVIPVKRNGTEGYKGVQLVI